MDILNVQSLIAQGLITDIASIDPNKAYITVGVYQPGNRPAGSGNNTYPSYAIPVAEFLATGGVYTGSNGIALVGNDFQLASHLISQFTNDSGYITSAAITGMVTGSGTLGKIPFWFPNGSTLGDSPLYTNGTQVGLNTVTPSAMFDIMASGSGTVGISLGTTSTQNAKLHFSTNNALTARAQVYLDDANQTLNIYTVNNDTVFWNGNGLAQVETMRLLTNNNVLFSGNVGINDPSPLTRLDVNGSMRVYGGGARIGDVGVGAYSFWGALSNEITTLFTGTGNNLILQYTGDGYVGIGTNAATSKLDVKGDATNPLFKLNNSNFLFADKLRVNNNGDFYSGSINTFGGFGSANFTTDHLNYKFNTSYQTYLAFTNAGGSGNRSGYGIIGSTIANADADYRLVILNNDAGTRGSVLKVVSTAINNENDGFDYTHHGVSVISNGVFTNSGAGTFYKVGISLDITNGDVNRAINVENGVIRVVKANQPLYATLTSGDFYYDTAANILANGDFVVGMKA